MKEVIYKTYQTKQQEFSASALKLKSRYTFLSWIRVLLFVGAIIGIIVFADQKNGAAMLITSAVAIIGYLALLKTHANLRSELKLTQALEQINGDEIKRLNNDLSGFEDGKKFYSVKHPYHEDLDVFGRHSLFQLINRTSTFLGEKVLASWLGHASSSNDVLQRQAAVKELSPDLAFRQNFEAYGKANSDSSVNHQPLLNWLKQEASLKNPLLLKLLMVVMPLAMVATIALSTLDIVQTGVPVLIGMANAMVLGSLFNRIQKISKQTEDGYKSLSAMRYHIEMIEKTEFSSEKLKALKSKVVHDNVHASKIIKELQLILDNFQSRMNVIYIIFDLLLLLDLFWYLKAVNWKQKNRTDITSWFDTIGELDALVSIAGFSYSNPSFNFPSISDDHFSINAKALGHPLINGENRVTNDFDFNGEGGICLITGSNMSGKSTFLRTVGVNCILGLMGAPVCASEMTVSPLRVFTSMRSQDDLEENVSSFYAELKRLKHLLSYIDGKTPVLFMIDEVLKGTNSKDRHKGALALIKQLNAAYAFGFVSTHDIELGTITNELKGVKNYSFNSQIVGDEIKFDYTLTPGICRSFNATKLMQKMGIEIPE